MFTYIFDVPQCASMTKAHHNSPKQAVLRGIDTFLDLPKGPKIQRPPEVHIP